MSNIEEILNEDISLEEKVRIIEENSKDNFNSLKSLDIKTIENIQKEINSVFKQVKKSKADVEKEIEKITSQIKGFQNDTIVYSTKEEYKEAFKNINEKGKEKISKEVQVIVFEKFINKSSLISNTLEDILVDIRKNAVSNDIISTNSKIESLENEIKDLNSKIENNEAKYEENKEFSDYLQKLLDNSQVDINSKPLSEREMDLAMSVIDTIYEYKEENSKLETEIEQEKENLERLEKELEQQKSLLSKNETKKEKQEKQEQAISEYVSRFDELCSKEKLGILENSELKSLFQIIDSSSYLKSEEKNKILVKYVNTCSKNKQENYEAKIKNTVNPTNDILNVSKVTSTIAKGKLTTIKMMQKGFEKLVDIKENVEKSVNNFKINSYGKVIDFLSAKKELLEQKQVTEQNQENIELESEEIEEVQKRVM